LADVEFIANARQDVPRLLDEIEIIEASYEKKLRRLSDSNAELSEAVEQLQSDVEFYSAWWDYFAKAHGQAIDENIELKAEVERLSYERKQYLERYVWLLEGIGKDKALDIIRKAMAEKEDE
jgi:cell division protein FtsB